MPPAQFGEQVLRRLQSMHAHGLLHLDCKPGNFLLPLRLERHAHCEDSELHQPLAPAAPLATAAPPAGAESVMKRSPVVFNIKRTLRSIVSSARFSHLELSAVDLGFARLTDPSGVAAAPPLATRSNRRRMVGAARFASVASHEGETLSRRDDLQSLAYMLAFLGRGELPWSDLAMERSIPKRERFERILSRKRRTSAAELFSGLPAPLQMFGERCGSLRQEEPPDYDALAALLRDAAAAL